MTEITFYSFFGKQYHITIYFENKTFSTNLDKEDRGFILKRGYGCFELKDFSRLKDLKIWLINHNFTECRDKNNANIAN